MEPVDLLIEALKEVIDNDAPATRGEVARIGGLLLHDELYYLQLNQVLQDAIAELLLLEENHGVREPRVLHMNNVDLAVLLKRMQDARSGLDTLR
jgi:hypothetical protein